MSTPARSERTGRYVAWAVLAAALYALSTPVAKLLMEQVAPGVLAALLYLGAGTGMGVVALLRGARRRRSAARSSKAVDIDPPLEREDLPYVLLMVGLDVVAPLLLMFGLARAQAANVALLNNFEIVATTVIALLVFGEQQGRRLWAGAAVITAACALLVLEDPGALRFSLGSLLVLGAATCWGLENNCTNRISHKDPVQIVIVKGLGSGYGSFLVASLAGERLPALGPALACLVLGFLAYGLSITLYVAAQRGLGAARTSAFYAIAPFIGVLLSWVLLRTEAPGLSFLLPLGLMALGTWLVLPPREQGR